MRIGPGLTLSGWQAGIVMYADIPLYVFAKAPVNGKVKTRLCPPLSADSATEVAEALLTRTVKTLVRFWPGRVVLTVAPDASHPVFEALIQEYRLDVEVQIESELGERMWHVLENGVQTHGAAAVVGTDIPGLNGSVLKKAYAAMSSEQTVIGPTCDGGFYFLGGVDFGCSLSIHHLFEDVSWGGAQVFQQVQRNARQHGVLLTHLPERDDLDDYGDLKKAARQFSEFKKFLA